MCLFRKQIEAAEDHRWVWLARIAVETEEDKDEWWWHKSKANATLGDDVDEAMRHRISFWFGYFASVSLVFLISLSLFHPLDHFHLLVCFDGKTSTHSLYYTDIYGLKDPLCMWWICVFETGIIIMKSAQEVNGWPVGLCTGFKAGTCI